MLIRKGWGGGLQLVVCFRIETSVLKAWHTGSHDLCPGRPKHRCQRSSNQTCTHKRTAGPLSDRCGPHSTFCQSLSRHLFLALFHSGDTEVGSVLSLPLLLPPSRPAACFKCLSISSAVVSQGRMNRKPPLSAGHLSYLKSHAHPPFLRSPPYSWAACWTKRHQ